jgi:hypothetical protein
LLLHFLRSSFRDCGIAVADDSVAGVRLVAIGLLLFVMQHFGTGSRYNIAI